MEDGNKNNTLVKKVVDLKPVGREDRFIRTKFGQFNTDDELLQSTARIKNQRDIIKERILKMETSKSRVTQAVYEKVRRDYSLQMQTINDLLAEKKDILKKQIKELYVIREKITMEIDRHREILEEANFRHFLGEFTEAQFHEVESFENKEVEKLEGDMAAIYSLIRMHESVFDPEDLGLPPAPPAPSSDVTKTVLPPLPPVKNETETRVYPEPQQIAAPSSSTAEPNQSQPQEQSASFSDEKTPLPAPMPETHAETLAKSEDLDISADAFSELFADEPAQESAALVQSQSNINKILGDEEPAKADSNKEDLSNLPELKDEDYFTEEKVNESSYSVTLPEKTDRLKVDTQEKSFVTEISKTSPNVSPAKDKNPDDSISELLDSIQLDDDSAQNVEAGTAPATAPQQQKPGLASSAGGSYRFTSLDGELDQPFYTLGENTSIGRSPSNDITLKAPKVSRQHAAINRYNNQYIIIDLKSSNGVYVNGAKIDEYVLKEGDEVSVGGYKFRFEKA